MARRVTRLYFNTFYDDVAERVLGELKGRWRLLRVERSIVVPELRFVEIEGAVAREAEELVRSVGGDKVFGVKAYEVEITGGSDG